MKCRHCDSLLEHTFLDLGFAPPSNAYLSAEDLTRPEITYPLKIKVCELCWLVQTEDCINTEELFNHDYAYFSSCSQSWLKHAKTYVDKVTERFNINKKNTVVEIAANDGYLLQYIKEKNIPCYGIEPTRSTGLAAKKKGIEIIESFFSKQIALKLKQHGRQADLLIANNVLAHVPDINDFVKSVAILLKSDGVATFEFPHLLNLVKYNQFDTIYHEHFSYLSLTTIQNIFEKNGLSLFDVEELPTHGGSLRTYVQLKDSGQRHICQSVTLLLLRENSEGITSLDYYTGFQEKVNQVKNDFLKFLIRANKVGKTVVGYGAAAKGNTFLNYAGVGSDLLEFVVDRNPAKQYKFLPGSHIAILNEEKLKQTQPDYVVILPWNLRTEIIEQLSYIRNWGGRFVIAFPTSHSW